MQDKDTGDLTGYCSIRFDITEKISLLERLEFQAHHDALTKLPNRRSLEKLLDAHFARNAVRYPIAICILDIDKFKEVNDDWGHPTGDQLLVSVARRLRSTVRPEDIVARFGGDEFVLLLQNISSTDEAGVVLEKIKSHLSLPFILDNVELSITVSMGVTLYETGDLSKEQSLRHADIALYHSKKNGANTFSFYDDKLEARNRLEVKLISEIEAAIDSGGLYLEYQPKINYPDGSIGGLEALIRYRRKDGKNVAPAEFMPFVESSNLVGHVGRWVIRQALKQIQENLEAGLVLPVSINVSTAHFQEKDFINQIEAILNDFPMLPTNLIDFEILENVALLNPASASQTINSCRQLGIGFSLDDFGTGYSSLSYLKNLPVQTLKIDRSFVVDILTNEDDFLLVKSIITIAGQFGLKLVAEGVENQYQAELLARMGCQQGQGWVYSPSLPGKEITKFALANSNGNRYSTSSKKWNMSNRYFFKMLLEHDEIIKNLKEDTSRFLTNVGAGGHIANICPLCDWQSKKYIIDKIPNKFLDHIAELDQHFHLIVADYLRTKQSDEMDSKGIPMEILDHHESSRKYFDKFIHDFIRS